MGLILTIALGILLGGVLLRTVEYWLPLLVLVGWLALVGLLGLMLLSGGS